jgi:hypothetical protein
MAGSTSPAKSPVRSPQSPKSPRSGLPPIKTSKPPSRTASNLVSPKYGEGPLCHNPVSPRTPKDMTGSAIERSTGIIYPYNLWGPCNPTKHGHLANVPFYNVVLIGFNPWTASAHWLCSAVCMRRKCLLSIT